MSLDTIKGKSALVTGANRGIGRAIAEELLERGAAKVYAGARNLDTLTDLQEKYGERVVPVQLDVTNPEQVQGAAKVAGDVQIIINNAGIAMGAPLLEAAAADVARQEMEVNYFGVMAVTQAFAPILASNGGGAIANVSSVAGLVSMPVFATYSASKAAVHSLTQASRALLADQNILVAGVYPGPIDTDMTKDFPMEKASPQGLAKSVIDGLLAGEEDIFPDPMAQDMAGQLRADPKAVEQFMAGITFE